MKKFFEEFKKFITRGNVLDMAVGVIVGGAFTAIVTALTSNILQPFINWIIYLIAGSDGSLDGVYTFLVGNATDLTNAIYIDWGAFISAIINFLLIAFVLFCVVKSINSIQEKNEKIKNGLSKKMLSKEDYKNLKKLGIKLTDKKAVDKYIKDKEAEEKAKLEQEQKEAEEKAKLERENNPTTEDLLKEILKTLKTK